MGEQLIFENIARELRTGRWYDIATCSAELGVYQGTIFTLPYGFTAEIEPRVRIKELGRNMIETGALVSLESNCGALLLSIGRIDIDVKLVHLLLLFSTEFGLVIFYKPSDIMYTPAVNDILKLSNSRNSVELVELGVNSFGESFLRGVDLKTEIFEFDRLSEAYNKLVKMGYIDNLRLRRTQFGWEYPRMRG